MQDINYSLIHLKNSLFKYHLSVFYRKIKLDKFNFNLTNKTYLYHNMIRIMNGLGDVTKFHQTIKDIVLVSNNNNLELYMLGNKYYSKMLEDKGMTILNSSFNQSSSNKKRKLNNNYETDESMKKYKPNSKNISLDIVKKELKSKRNEPKIKSQSIDDKLIEKFRSLTEKDKNNLLSFLDKTPEVNDTINENDNDIDIIIDRNGKDYIDKKPIENEKEVIICEPSIGEIIINKGKTSKKDVNVNIHPIREKRNVKKIIRYQEQFC